MASPPPRVKITKIRFHYPGFNEVRKAPELVADLKERGERIAEAAHAEGGEFAVVVRQNKTRARVVVVTADIEAKAGEAKDRRLTRALGAGRG
jgi:hypothetical protein